MPHALAHGAPRLGALRAIAESAASHQGVDLGERLCQARLLVKQGKRPQPGGVHKHPGIGNLHHATGHRRVPALVVAAAHLARPQHLGPRKGVHKRRLPRPALAQKNRASARHDKAADLLDPKSFRHAHGDDGHVLPHGEPHLLHKPRQTFPPARPVGLREQHARGDAALARKHDRAHETVARQVALGERLGHEHRVDVGREHLPGAPHPAVPTGKLGRAGQHRLDDGLVVTLRRVKYHPIAHSGTEVAEPVLYQRDRMLGTQGPISSLHKRVAPVEADDAAQARARKLLARLGALLHKGLERGLDALVKRKVVKARLKGELPGVLSLVPQALRPPRFLDGDAPVSSRFVL